MSEKRERESEREKPTMMLRLDVTRGKSKHEKFFSSTE